MSMQPSSRPTWLAQLDSRYLAPVLVTCILIGAHLSFGVLEGYSRTGAAIGTAIAAELVFGRITYGHWLNPASAYVTGISVGMLVRSPFLWPYVLASLISITSKYVIRLKGRHIWNPSNFGVSTVLFLAPATVSHLSIQWGNTVWPMLIIWTLGCIIVYRVGRLNITATYVISFLFFAFVRSQITGNPWLSTIAPLTGPMYQLYVFFMITDPKTTVRSKVGQCVVVFLVAFIEMLFRLGEVVYAPFYALFWVGMPAMVVEAWLDQQKADEQVAAQPALS
jgi:Na+-transporting NADH:ubiquinone oxidoreductase subunit NqrB